MPGQKVLINRTGNELKVTLVVRQGENPEHEANRVVVTLASGPDLETREDRSQQSVTYGNDQDIFLNGLELVMEHEGSGVLERQVVAERGSGLDNVLNQNCIIEFVYDGNTVLFSSRNEPPKEFSFSAIADL